VKFALSPKKAPSSVAGPPLLHVVATPLDDEAQALGIWPTSPLTLCGDRLRDRPAKGRPVLCAACREKRAFLESAVRVTHRIRARQIASPMKEETR
jgi:hypothetical protein